MASLIQPGGRPRKPPMPDGTERAAASQAARPCPLPETAPVPAPESLRRRQFMRMLGACVVGLGDIPLLGAAPGARHTRPIPRSGEQIPVVGMGTYLTFDVRQDSSGLASSVEVLRAFHAAGGGLVDSSPMYDSSESTLGHCLDELAHPPGLFSATKVWTLLARDGAHQLRASRDAWGLQGFDLLQVHNLLNWQGHLPTLMDERASGRARYIGVTTSHGRRHEELERIMRSQAMDFVQFTYNIEDREAERRLLPLAAQLGIAVIINRPFQRGALLRRLARHPLPAWASEIDCHSWAQFLLKFVISHPAVTCAIPATSQATHMYENMRLLRSPLADAATRQRMIAYVESL